MIQLPEHETLRSDRTNSPRRSDEDLLEMCRRMLTIRLFEERTAVLYAAGNVPGFVHVSVGQEATGCWGLVSLRVTDGIVSNHRGHGHCLARAQVPRRCSPS